MVVLWWWCCGGPRSNGPRILNVEALLVPVVSPTPHIEGKKTSFSDGYKGHKNRLIV